MTSSKNNGWRGSLRGRRWHWAWLLWMPVGARPCESDRQQPLEVIGSLHRRHARGWPTVLRGNVDIRQGSLHIRANQAEVLKQRGKVQLITLRGKPAYLEQAIEEQGLVQAEASHHHVPGRRWRGGTARATPTCVHPQYEIDGDQLTYDLDKQHFEGSGSGSPTGAFAFAWTRKWRPT